MPDTSPRVFGAPGLSPEALLGRAFATVRKGLDPTAVRQALEDAASALREAYQREEELSARLVEVQQRVDTPQIDEQMLTTALGIETAKVLQAAREAARELVESAERRAAATELEATEVLQRNLREAEQQRATIVERSENEARTLLARAEQESRSMIDEARLARRKILSDLAERRRALHLQLEQLRAGKDALILVIDQTAGAVDTIRGRLEGAEGVAQLAADQAARLGVAQFEDQSIDAVVKEALDSLESAVEAPALDNADTSNEEHDRFATDPVGRPDDRLEQDKVESGTATLGGAPDERDATALVTDETILGGSRLGELALPLEADGSGAPVQALQGDGEIDAAPPEHKTKDSAIDDNDTDDNDTDDNDTDDNAADDNAADDNDTADNDGEVVASPIDDEGSPALPSVEELFARIRASREVETERARAVLDDPDASFGVEGAPTVPTESLVAETGASQTSKGAVAAPLQDLDEPNDQGHDELGGDLEPEEDLGGIEPVVARRAELLAPSVDELTRALKRVLRVEQNELLDAIRTVKGVDDLSELLPGEETAGQFALAGDAGLRQAFGAGWQFALESATDDVALSLGVDDELIAATAALLGQELVAVVVSRVQGEGTGEDVEAFSARVGSAFRELRGGRLEQFCEGFAVRCFAEAELQVAGQLARQVSWQVDDGTTRCAECDDNQISGPQMPGEKFPTGHRVPPVHEGCRCFLVLSDK